MKGRYNLPRRFHDLSRNGWPLSSFRENTKPIRRNGLNEHLKFRSVVVVAWRITTSTNKFINLEFPAFYVRWMITYPDLVGNPSILQRLWFDRWPGVATSHQLNNSNQTQRCRFIYAKNVLTPINLWINQWKRVWVGTMKVMFNNITKLPLFWFCQTWTPTLGKLKNHQKLMKIV